MVQKSIFYNCYASERGGGICLNSDVVTSEIDSCCAYGCYTYSWLNGQFLITYASSTTFYNNAVIKCSDGKKSGDAPVSIHYEHTVYTARQNNISFCSCEESTGTYDHSNGIHYHAFSRIDDKFLILDHNTGVVTVFMTSNSNPVSLSYFIITNNKPGKKIYSLLAGQELTHSYISGNSIQYTGEIEAVQSFRVLNTAMCVGSTDMFSAPKENHIASKILLFLLIGLCE